MRSHTDEDGQRRSDDVEEIREGQRRAEDDRKVHRRTKVRGSPESTYKDKG